MKILQANLKHSKTLRVTQTPWEAKLWMYLRANRLIGLKFKRQVPIDRYIVDFCCDEKKLVIELDGGHHSESSIKEVDASKQKYLESEDYTVLRFWNNEIDNNLEGVLNKIIEVATSPPTPPHAWGGGKHRTSPLPSP